MRKMTENTMHASAITTDGAHRLRVLSDVADIIAVATMATAYTPFGYWFALEERIGRQVSPDPLNPNPTHLDKLKLPG